MMSRILPIVLIVFAAGLFFVYVRPTYTGPIQETKTKIASFDAALAAASRFQDKEAQLTAARAQISPENLQRLSSFLPDGVDNVQLILDLDALAARSGVTLSNFNVPEQGSDSGTTEQSNKLALATNSAVGSLDLTFSSTATYDSFRRFLSGIEQSLRPLDITALTVKQSNTGVYTYDVTVRIYWLQ